MRLATMDQLEYRAIIKFLTKQGKTPQDILSEMKTVYGDKCPGKTMIYKWYGLFRQGRESIEEEPRTIERVKNYYRKAPV